MFPKTRNLLTPTNKMKCSQFFSQQAQPSKALLKIKLVNTRKSNQISTTTFITKAEIIHIKHLLFRLRLRIYFKMFVERRLIVITLRRTHFYMIRLKTDCIRNWIAVNLAPLQLMEHCQEASLLELIK